MPSRPLSDIMSQGAVARTTVRSGIQYVMMHLNGTEFQRDIAPDHQQASFLAAVRWDDTFQFAIDMLGTHTNVAGKIQRFDPEKHPLLPALYCIGIKLQECVGTVSFDPANPGCLHYDFCKLLCTFSPLMYDLGVTDATVNGDVNNNELLRYVEREGDDTGESIQTLGAFRFVSDNAPIPTPPAIMTPYSKLTYIWHHVPDPITTFLARARTYYGTVNSQPFDVPKDTLAIGTVLYLGVAKRQRIPGTPTGNVEWKITQQFMFRQQGWNNSLRFNRLGQSGNVNGWEAVQLSIAPNSPPYVSQDHNQLFKLF